MPHIDERVRSLWQHLVLPQPILVDSELEELEAMGLAEQPQLDLNQRLNVLRPRNERASKVQITEQRLHQSQRVVLGAQDERVTFFKFQRLLYLIQTRPRILESLVFGMSVFYRFQFLIVLERVRGPKRIGEQSDVYILNQFHLSIG